MKEPFVILYKGEPITVEEVEDTGGHFSDRYDYQLRLLRDEDGGYYVWTRRTVILPDWQEQLACAGLRDVEHDGDELKMRRLLEDRAQFTKPQTTIKRLTEAEAMQWCIKQFITDETIKGRLRQAVQNAHG